MQKKKNDFFQVSLNKCFKSGYMLIRTKSNFNDCLHVDCFISVSFFKLSCFSFYIFSVFFISLVDGKHDYYWNKDCFLTTGSKKSLYEINSCINIDSFLIKFFLMNFLFSYIYFPFSQLRVKLFLIILKKIICIFQKYPKDYIERNLHLSIFVDV